MLKERFLNRDDAIYADENFTDDEESDDDADGTGESDVFPSLVLHCAPLHEWDLTRLTALFIMLKIKTTLMRTTTITESRTASLSILRREQDVIESWKSSKVTLTFRGRVLSMKMCLCSKI